MNVQTFKKNKKFNSRLGTVMSRNVGLGMDDELGLRNRAL
jgi:hypothetical protein